MNGGITVNSRSKAPSFLIAAGVLAAFSMAAARSAEDDPKSAAPALTGPRIFYLDAKGRLLTAKPDGSDLRVLLSSGMSGPDGVAVDVEARQIYWTNMGKVKDDDGSIQRLGVDGTNLTTIIPVGGTFTAKQLKLDKKNGKLYWSDREGMRVMRANLDGSHLETLIEAARGVQARLDARNWCVGIAVDTDRGKIYWTQKGGDNANLGVIRRANIEIPKGETAANRSDVEVLFDGLPEPIDMDLDLKTRMMYWTDRGDPPNGNTVNRAPMDIPAGFDPKNRKDLEILVTGLREGIGISLDLKGGQMFFTDLSGTVYAASLDGSDKKILLTGQGSLTGITFVELSK
jgi:DNA-binding beta-propeller fold protein YncE